MEKRLLKALDAAALAASDRLDESERERKRTAEAVAAARETAAALKESQEAVAALQRQLIEHHSTTAGSEDEAKVREAELEASEARRRAADAELKETASRLRGAEAELEDLRKDDRSGVAALAAKRDADNRAAAARGDLEAARDDVRALERDKDALARDADQLKDELDASRAECDALAEKAARLRNDGAGTSHLQLASQLAAARCDLEAETRRAQALEKQLEDQRPATPEAPPQRAGPKNGDNDEKYEVLLRKLRDAKRDLAAAHADLEARSRGTPSNGHASKGPSLFASARSALAKHKEVHASLVACSVLASPSTLNINVGLALLVFLVLC